VRQRDLLTGVSSEDNGLNAVRLTLAFAVLVSHSFALTGRVEPRLAGLTLGTWAVLGFFAVSGYLVTGSGLSLSAGRFVWHRTLRIFPAYWVALLVTAFVLAPVVSTLRGEAWSVLPAVRYAIVNATTWPVARRIDGTLLHVDRLDGGPTGPWNGSTWTLRFELGCYLLALVVLSIRQLRRPGTAAALLALAIGARVVTPGDWRSMMVFLTPFAAGMMLRLLGGRVRLSVPLALAAVFSLLAASEAGLGAALGALPLAYLVLAAGAVWTRAVPRRRDLSYGVYIYAWPIQQVLCDVGAGRWPLLVFVAVVTAAVVPAAWGSWSLVERPALRLKSVGRGRRLDLGRVSSRARGGAARVPGPVAAGDAGALGGEQVA